MSDILFQLNKFCYSYYLKLTHLTDFLFVLLVIQLAVLKCPTVTVNVFISPFTSVIFAVCVFALTIRSAHKFRIVLLISSH